MCAWRKEIKGPSLRGPVEYSNKPEFISGVDEDSSVRCLFSDGDVYDVGHITMVSRRNWQFSMLYFFMLVLRKMCILGL